MPSYLLDVPSITTSMPSSSHWCANFFKTHFLIKVVRLLHPGNRFEVATGIAERFCSFDTNSDHFLAKAEATEFRQKIHFLQFTNVPTPTDERADATTSEHLATTFAGDHEECCTRAAVCTIHVIYLGVEDGVPLPNAAKLGHHCTDNQCNLLVISRLDGSKGKLGGIIRAGKTACRVVHLKRFFLRK